MSECYCDRYGGDERNVTVYTTTFDGCVRSCDTDSSCVAISYVPNAQAGSPGPCYLKNVLNENGVIRQTVWGARRLDAHTVSRPLPEAPPTPSIKLQPPRPPRPPSTPGNIQPFVGLGSFPENGFSDPLTVVIVPEIVASSNLDGSTSLNGSPPQMLQPQG